MPKSLRVCPDWEDMVCSRGTRCPFSHPEDIKQPENRINICRDFQNSQCPRGTRCFPRKHFTRQEESNYYKTGEMPNHEGDPKKVGGTNPEKPEIEFCRVDESRSGSCLRGDKCIYRHRPPPLKRDSIQDIQDCMGQVDTEHGHHGGTNGIGPVASPGHHDHYVNYRKRDTTYVHTDSVGPVAGAGPRGGMDRGVGQMGTGHIDHSRNQSDSLEPPWKRPLMDGGSEGLNVELQKKDEKLNDFRKKITDLRDMNDLLYEQNEDLGKKLAEKDKRIALLESRGQSYTVSYTSADRHGKAGRDADLYD